MPDIVDLIDLDVSEPTCFYTWGGEAWLRGPVSPLIHSGPTLRFEFFDPDEEQWEETRVMTLEDDGLYHFRGVKEHRWAFLAETRSHVYLTGNFINEDGSQGVEMWIWPREAVRFAPSALKSKGYGRKPARKARTQ